MHAPGGITVASLEKKFRAQTAVLQECITKRFSFLDSSPYIHLSVFDHTSLPAYSSKTELYKFGNEDIAALTDYYEKALPLTASKEQMKKEWIKLKSIIVYKKHLKSMDVYETLVAENSDELKNILHLVKIAMTISISTAKVERSFSKMNQIKNKKSNKMSQQNLNSRMRIMAQAVPVKEYDTTKAVTHWLTSGKRKRKIVSQGSQCVTAAKKSKTDKPELPHLNSDNSESEFEGFGSDLDVDMNELD